MQFQSSESKDLFLLSLLPGFTTHKLRIFEQNNCSLSQILQDIQDLNSPIEGFDKRLISKWRMMLTEIDLEILNKKLEALKVEIITIKDDLYPEALRQIYDAPLVLYLRGNTEILRSKKIAIVGTRKLSSYGREITQKISAKIAAAGIAIVSGLARGVDEMAHSSALKSSGQTIAVLGSAVDQIYPSANRNLAMKMIESGRGLIVSEFPLGTKPAKYTFPMRNRIISGLSLATIVTEAGSKSGALITAQMAVDQGREVFAVPGNVAHSGSHGTHYLIKHGAKLIASAQEVMQEMSLSYNSGNKQELRFENPLEEKIYNLLLLESRHGDQLKKELNINIEMLNSTLTMMELKGYVRCLEDRKYIAS